jgi:hypothetical protein
MKGGILKRLCRTRSINKRTMKGYHGVIWDEYRVPVGDLSIPLTYGVDLMFIKNSDGYIQSITSSPSSPSPPFDDHFTHYNLDSANAPLPLQVISRKEGYPFVHITCIMLQPKHPRRHRLIKVPFINPTKDSLYIIRPDTVGENTLLLTI